MWHQLIFGLLLGWGAAIPIGPVNIEIIRRNLRFGTLFGINFGLGACSADLTYFILLLAGVLAFLKNPMTLRIIGVVGALILIWFALSAFKIKTKKENRSVTPTKPKDPVAWHHYFQGYLMTLFNPFTILFWASISIQLAALSSKGIGSAIYTGIGVLIGTLSWSVGLNIVIHNTRHRLPPKTMHYLNYTGGVIILAFAAYGLWHALT